MYSSRVQEFPLQEENSTRSEVGKQRSLLDSVEIYIPSSNTWTEGPSLPSTLSSGCAINVDGKIYLIGGANGGGGLKQVLGLDNLSNQWNTHAEMPTAQAEA